MQVISSLKVHYSSDSLQRCGSGFSEYLHLNDDGVTKICPSCAGKRRKMEKQIYDTIIREYSKETKESLAQQIIVLKQLHCEDRCFAEGCHTDSSLSDITSLLTALDEMRTDCSGEAVQKVCSLVEKAKTGWNHILAGINLIGDPYRYGIALEKFQREHSFGDPVINSMSCEHGNIKKSK